jgi:uncharacterized membrane protein
MEDRQRRQLRYWIQAAMIAALYVLMTVIPYLFSYGLFQVRVAEALMVLPYFTPAAIPGLFVGCLIANLVGPYGILDVVFGSLATLISAVLVARIKVKALVPLPPVLINALIVGLVLHYVLQLPLYLTAGMVGLGQLVACYGLGYPLLLVLEKRKDLFTLK